MADEKTEKSRAVDVAISQMDKQFGKGSVLPPRARRRWFPSP